MSVVSIVGAGTLGGALAQTIAARDRVRSIRLVDEAADVAAGKALDIRQSAPLDGFGTRITAHGDIAAAAGADVVLLAGPAAAPDTDWTDDAGLALLDRLGAGRSGAIILCAGASHRRLVERAAAGGPARVVDTRKTTPGLRELERYAVRAGGAFNHRNTLEDGVLIKDNHLRAGEARGIGIAGLIREARRAVPHTLRVEVEVTDEGGARAAVEAGADVILLDNMSPAEMSGVVERLGGGRVLFEASGGITLETAAAVAASGVQLISSGALTHSAPALDVALDIVPGPEPASR